jgi:hypothetical protein
MDIMLYKSISKLTLYSILMIVFLIVGFTLLGIYWNDWIKYDSNYLSGKPDYILPVSVQVIRVLTIVPLILSIMTWLASLWETNKIDDKRIKKTYFLTGGLFVWSLLPYTFYLAYQTKSYQNFWKYLKTHKEGNEQINFYKWFKNFKGTKPNKLFWNTL